MFGKIDFGPVLEITLTLVLVYLVLSNWQGFSSVISNLGSVYVNSVKTLQGR